MLGLDGDPTFDAEKRLNPDGGLGREGHVHRLHRRAWDGQYLAWANGLVGRCAA